MFNWIFDLDRVLCDPGQLRDLINGKVAVAARNAEIPERYYGALMEAAQHRGFDERVLKIEGITLAQKQALIEAHRSLKAPAYFRSYGDLHHIPLLTGRKFLVTRGVVRLQSSKITALRIGDMFEEVHIIPHEKAEAYRDIARRRELPHERVIVVGDHEHDLMPAFALGMVPVQMLRPGTKTVCASYQVGDLAGLVALEKWLIRAYSRHSP